MIKLKGLTQTFERQIFKSANFTIKKNEIVGLVGKSGTGKSTLLKVLSGRLQPDEGSMFWMGEKMPEPKELLIPGYKNIALVDQEFKLDIYHTVEENIRETILAWPFYKRERRVRKLLTIFGLNRISTTKAEFVSGGEKQRIAIARAIANYPDVLLLDEPFSHLDSSLKQRLIEVLMNVRIKENISIVLVSHDPQDILGLCDKICFVRNKKISKKYSPIGLYYNLRNIQIARLFGPVNTIDQNGTKYRFRPDEYTVLSKGEGIAVTYEKSIFFSGIYHSYFYCGKDIIVLYAFEPLSNVNLIQIINKAL